MSLVYWASVGEWVPVGHTPAPLRRKLDDLKPSEADVREILAGVELPGVTTALSELALESPEHRVLVEFVARELTRELPVLLKKRADDLTRVHNHELERLHRAGSVLVQHGRVQDKKVVALSQKYETVKKRVLEHRMTGISNASSRLT